MWYLGGEEDSDFLEDLSKKENQPKNQKQEQSQPITPHIPPQQQLLSPKPHLSPVPHHILRHQSSYNKMHSPQYVPQSDASDSDLGNFILHSSTEISPFSSKSSSRLNTPSSSRPATPTNSLPTNITLTLLAEEERIKNRRAFAEFLKSHACYDIMPASVKIVVLDTKLPIQSAFQALVENGIKAAPLWDATNHEFNGMITVSDFIDILLEFSKNPAAMNNIVHELANYQIKTWRETCQTLPTLISIEPDMTLLDASNLLVKNQIHRLPVIDQSETNSILHMITHYRILHFLVKNFPSSPINPILQCTIGSLGIGTYDHVVTVLQDTPLIVVLDLLAARKISAVPIVDEHGVIIDVYSKSDAPQIVKMGALTPTDLDRAVSELLQLHNKRSEQIMTCLKTETLKDILDKCLAKRVHRLIIVDSTKRVEGIVSLSDILRFFLG